MTKNQIEYQKLQETMRANRANEAITSARDQASRRLGLDTLQETARHNQQVELQARDNLAEQYRNNLAQLEELQRSHLASEGLSRESIINERYRESETQRHNQQLEEETQRHNVASEDISLLGQGISRAVAEIGAQSHIAAAGIGASASQYASDMSLLAKQLQVDLDKYGIDVNKELRSNELAESRRAAVARQSEINRANRAQEGIQSGSMLENIRHNMVSEGLSRVKNTADVRLRGEQNAIAQYQAETARQRNDIDLELVPSRKFASYTQGLASVTNAAGSLINVFRRKS